MGKFSNKAKKVQSAPLFTEEKKDKSAEIIQNNDQDAEMVSERKVSNGSFFDHI